MKKLFILIICVFGFSVSFAQTFPQPPCRFYGHVFIDGVKVEYEDNEYPIVEIVDENGESFYPEASNGGEIGRLDSYICDVPVKQDNGIIGADEYDKLYYTVYYNNQRLRVLEPLYIYMPDRDTWDMCYQEYDLYVTTNEYENTLLKEVIHNLQILTGKRYE